MKKGDIPYEWEKPWGERNVGWHEEIKNCKHEYEWADTSIGGFGQCRLCHVIDSKITEKDCIDQPDPVLIKQKKLAAQEKKRQATIEWLKKQGKL